MNNTDQVKVRFADGYYQSAIKWIDDFLMKYKATTPDSPGAGGAQVFQAADGRDDLDRVMGAINTIVMKVEDRVGIITNWDQGSPTAATARIKSYVPVNDDNTGVMRDRNINDGMA